MEKMESHISEFKPGKYSPLPEEIEKVRKEAAERGGNPDEAERSFRKRFEEATARKQILIEGKREQEQIEQARKSGL